MELASLRLPENSSDGKIALPEPEGGKPHPYSSGERSYGQPEGGKPHPYYMRASR
jgi:hypothetical protein